MRFSVTSLGFVKNIVTSRQPIAIWIRSLFDFGWIKKPNSTDCCLTDDPVNPNISSPKL